MYKLIWLKYLKTAFNVQIVYILILTFPNRESYNVPHIIVKNTLFLIA